MSSIARVIFLVASTDLIRARSWRRDTATSDSLLLDDLLLLDLLVRKRLVLLAPGLQRATLTGLELVEEVVVRLAHGLLGLVGPFLGLADGVEDTAVALEVVEELALEAQHVLDRYDVEQAGGAEEDR